MAVEIISELKQKNNIDFPIVDSNNIRGGYYQVETLAARNNIPVVRRKEGMLCYVLLDPTELHLYLLINNEWQAAKFGSGGGSTIVLPDPITMDNRLDSASKNPVTNQTLTNNIPTSAVTSEDNTEVTFYGDYGTKELFSIGLPLELAEGETITVDLSLSKDSSNPISNKAVTNALSDVIDTIPNTIKIEDRKVLLKRGGELISEDTLPPALEVDPGDIVHPSSPYYAGIPLYDNYILSYLPSEELALTYVKIPTDRDLIGEVTDNNISRDPNIATSVNGTYLDVIFSSLRALLSEVARLKNTFKYGLNSYNGNMTAMSTVVNGYKELDEEPLWAVDESELSEVLQFNSETSFEPSENISLDGGTITFNGQATWIATEEVTAVEDPKLFIYLTTTGKNIEFICDNLTFNLNNIGLPNYETYNILVVISKTLELKTGVKKGYSYIWISILDNYSGDVITSGYLNTSSNRLLKSLYELVNNNNLQLINFSNLSLSKCSIYTKYLDFTNSIEPSLPTDEDYKYKVAHITIRSVANKEEMQSILNLLQNNELIWNEYGKSLWIKSKGRLLLIGAGNNNWDDEDDDTMTGEQILAELKELGIISGENDNLSINNIGDITFIHQDTGKKFKFLVDGEGNLYSQEEGIPLVTEKFNNNRFDDTLNIRGFLGRLRISNNYRNADAQRKDAKLEADRLKIGAIYAPLKTDLIHGCSHAFIELENTSDEDINLKGFKLNYAKGRVDNIQESEVFTLNLTGVIKAGSTYLIRGKKYSDSAETYIKVNTFDQEWYTNGELIDFSCESGYGYALALTYGYGKEEGLTAATKLWNIQEEGVTGRDKAYLNYPDYYVDSISFYAKLCAGSENRPTWAINCCFNGSNMILKNTFELDPAKQAFLALNIFDSSRYRNDKVGSSLTKPKTDSQFLVLDSPEISFTHSSNTYPVSKYTPKSSKENKNISTDKTKLNTEKPNMVTCAFGINAHTTRCFNWISCGIHDEYVFIKNGDSWIKYESYKAGDSGETTTEVGRKEFSSDIINAVYKRMSGRFPGDGTAYTAHKCIINIVNTPVASPTTYTYIVGRANANGTPDLNHCSEEYTFTLYPTTGYTPKIYLITDLQGFHWIEYQVWAAAANKINELISNEPNTVIPVLINTGDMTLNGTRINEWLDYYNAGRELFKKYEQMNVVGNNDLCGPDPEILGTGDDPGKSNSYYFHVFYCYEVDTNITPLFTGSDNVTRYIPSLYYFDICNYRLVMVNSEITAETCKSWFKATLGDDVINIYTGWSIKGADSLYALRDKTTIYEMIKNYLSDTSKKYVVACHEMPFTVVTSKNLEFTQTVTKSATISRSIDVSSNNLVGSHLNLLNASDTKSNYWFSRLLEDKGIKLCIGGHKHTYALTYPIRENYKYEENKNSALNGRMTMPDTLETDTVEWIGEGLQIDANRLSETTHLSKFPLIKIDNGDYDSTQGGLLGSNGHLYPCKVDTMSNQNYVVYLMCQATGYKLTSNKELPSTDQVFSRIIPKTTTATDDLTLVIGDSPDGELRSPMYAVITLNSNSIQGRVVKIQNIFGSDYVFSLSNYSKEPMYLEYLQKPTGDVYGKFSPTESDIINITL